MIGTHPVAHSFSIGRDTLGYPLVFKLSGHCRDIYMIVFNWSCHTQFNTCFQMVGKHAVTHSFSNGWDTLGYILVFKCSGHTRIHTHFQVVVAHSVTHSFSNGRDTPGYTFVFKRSGHTPGYILVFN